MAHRKQRGKTTREHAVRYCSFFEHALEGIFRSTPAGRFLEVTARKRAEEALRASEARYRNLFENANDMIATFTLDGTITSVNRGLEVTLG